MKLNMYRLLAPTVLSFSAVGLTSCASLFDGTSQQVTFSSPQPGSSITVEGEKSTLPVTKKISKKTKTATFTNSKYNSKELAWKRDFQAGFLLMDVLFTPGFGVVGLVWDGSTQAWYKQPAVIDYNFATGKSSVTEEVP